MIPAMLSPSLPLSPKQPRATRSPFGLHFWDGVWPRCGSLSENFPWHRRFRAEPLLSTVPGSRWIHQPLFSLHGHLWCHCKHKLCPQMKDQPGFVPLWGQTNSKYGQAMTWIMGLGGHYGGNRDGDIISFSFLFFVCVTHFATISWKSLKSYLLSLPPITIPSLHLSTTPYQNENKSLSVLNHPQWWEGYTGKTHIL